MTIEDPIEFLHRDKKSIVNQREVDVDTQGLLAGAAQRAAPGPRRHPGRRNARLRDDRDRRCTAAETGHLVFSTLHTLDATETINRIISVFPPHQQKQIRLQLGARAQGGHLAAPDAARRRPRPRAGRRDPDPHQLHPRVHREQGEDEVHQGRDPAGTSQYGMQTFDQSLYSLYKSGLITLDEALKRCDQPERVQAARSRASSPPPTSRARRWTRRSRRPSRLQPAAGGVALRLLQPASVGRG